MEEEEVELNLFSPKLGFTSVFSCKDQMLWKIQTRALNHDLLMQMHVQDDGNALLSADHTSPSDLHVWECLVKENRGLNVALYV